MFQMRIALDLRIRQLELALFFVDLTMQITKFQKRLIKEDKDVRQ